MFPDQPQVRGPDANGPTTGTFRILCPCRATSSWPGSSPPADREQWAAAVAKALDRTGELAPDAALARLRTTTYDGITIEPLYTAADAPAPDAAGLPGQRAVRAWPHRPPAPRPTDGTCASASTPRPGRAAPWRSSSAAPPSSGSTSPDGRRRHRRGRRRRAGGRACSTWPRSSSTPAPAGRPPPTRSASTSTPARSVPTRSAKQRPPTSRADALDAELDAVASWIARLGADRPDLRVVTDRRHPLPRRRRVRRPAARRHHRRRHRLPPGPRRRGRRAGRGDRPHRAAPRRHRRPVRHDRHVPGRPEPVGSRRRGGRRARRHLADPRRHGVGDDDRLRPVGERAALHGRLLRRRHRRRRRRHRPPPRPPARRRGDRARPPHRPQHAVDPARGVAPRRGPRPGRRLVVRRVVHRPAGRRGLGAGPGDRGRRRVPGGRRQRPRSPSASPPREPPASATSTPARRRSPGLTEFPEHRRAGPVGGHRRGRRTARRRTAGARTSRPCAGASTPSPPSGDRPSVFLATIGPAAVFTPRITFARNFFEVAGLATTTGPVTDDPADDRRGLPRQRRHRRLPVLERPRLRRAGRARRRRPCSPPAPPPSYVAGRPKAALADLAAIGVERTIHVGADVRATLAELLGLLEVP